MISIQIPQVPLSHAIIIYKTNVSHKLVKSMVDYLAYLAFTPIVPFAESEAEQYWVQKWMSAM